MSKHTLLPVLSIHRGTDYAVILRPGDATDTALVLIRHPSDADIALLTVMAAAPAMLHALKGVIPYMEAAEEEALVGHEGCHWPVEFVRDAIAKAEGQP